MCLNWHFWKMNFLRYIFHILEQNNSKGACKFYITIFKLLKMSYVGYIVFVQAF